MFYVQRDASGHLQRVEVAPFEGMSETLTAEAHEIQAWFANQDVESSLLQLKQSDLDMIRVVDDLVHLLIIKGVIRITGPAASGAGQAAYPLPGAGISGRAEPSDQ